jgi:hypothetical protein
MVKKQDAFKHLHEPLILELVYFDRSNMIMYFGWCNHKEEFKKVSHNMHGILSCAYQRYWLQIKTKWGKIYIPVYLLALRQGIAPTHPQRDGIGIKFVNGNYHGRYTLDGTLRDTQILLLVYLNQEKSREKLPLSQMLMMFHRMS